MTNKLSLFEIYTKEIHMDLRECYESFGGNYEDVRSRLMKDELIQRLVIDHLHIVGDIYDRGTEPHRILDLLLKHPSVDKSHTLSIE